MMPSRFLRAAIAAACLAAPLVAHGASEQQSLEELRNTVVNLLQALVDQGVMTREKAQALVKQAQDKAAADAGTAAKADEGAIRVPYVPEPVREQIRQEVAAEVGPKVVEGVVARAKQEGWGVPGALPEWLSRVRISGEVKLRNEEDLYAKDNIQNFYKNYQAINNAGSEAKADVNLFTDVSNDRYRLRTRARIGVEAEVSPSVTAGVRLSSGNLQDPSSEFQTLGNYGSRYQTDLDQIWLRWDGRNAGNFPYASLTGGRMAGPWLQPTNLVFYQELQFEGIAATGRIGFGDGTIEQSHAFLTLGALPIQETALSSRHKILLGAQLGTNLRTGDTQRLRLGAAYYDFKGVQGVRDSFGLHDYDYTAPAWLQQGNTVFNIRNDLNATNLYGLASQFRVVDVSLAYEAGFGRYSFSIAGDAVRNIGFNEAQVEALTGFPVPQRNKGYQLEFGFGYPTLGAFGRWRASLGYRYVERDAVLDAWTDTDFHEGGTDAKGYYFVGDFGLGSRLWARLRYLSANEIDGPAGVVVTQGPPKYGVDVLQFDIVSAF